MFARFLGVNLLYLSTVLRLLDWYHVGGVIQKHTESSESLSNQKKDGIFWHDNDLGHWGPLHVKQPMCGKLSILYISLNSEKKNIEEISCYHVMVQTYIISGLTFRI